VHNGDPVSYGRWEESRHELERRIAVLESEIRDHLAPQVAGLSEIVKRRRALSWKVTALLLTSVVLPLIGAGIGALLSGA